MCELLAINSSRPLRVDALLREFFSHGLQHPHGWGLALRSESGASLEKEPMCAAQSAYLRKRLEGPLFASHAIGHIRYATIGDLSCGNCHPFSRVDQSGRTWTLAHNGTIFATALIDCFFEEALGETDSEAILLYLLARIDAAISSKGGLLSDDERFAVLDSAIAALSVDNKLNLAIDDGTFTYVHTNYLKESLFLLQHDSLAVCSTHPLQDGIWNAVPLTRLTALHDGEITRQGTPHDNVYAEPAAGTSGLCRTA